MRVSRWSGDDVGAYRGGRGEDAVVGNEVGSGWGDEGGELLDEGHGFEDGSGRSVSKGVAEVIDDLAVFGLFEPVLGDRGSGRVSEESLESVAVASGDSGIGVEGEAFGSGAARSDEIDRTVEGVLVEPLDRLASVGSEGDAALDRGRIALGEEGFIEGQVLEVDVFGEPVFLQIADDLCADLENESADLEIVEGVFGMESGCVVFVSRIRSVEGDEMEVGIERQRRTIPFVRK